MQIGCAVLLTDNQTADMQTEDILTVQPLYIVYKYVEHTPWKCQHICID